MWANRIFPLTISTLYFTLHACHFYVSPFRGVSCSIYPFGGVRGVVIVSRPARILLFRMILNRHFSPFKAI